LKRMGPLRIGGLKPNGTGTKAPRTIIKD